MVTLAAATLRATPAKNAVNPARAPEDRSRPAIGAFTEPDVILTIRPNFLAIIGSIDFLRQLDRHDHVGDDAVDELWPVELAEVAKRRPAVVVDQNVRLRAGVEQRLLAVGAATSATTGMILAPVVLLKLGGGGHKPLAVAAVDHDLAARLRQRLGAGPAEPAARRTHDRLAAGNSQIHDFIDPTSRTAGVSRKIGRPDFRQGHATIYGHFTTGGSEDKMDSTLPPVRKPKIVPRS